MATLSSIRNTPPATRDHLWHWVRAYCGVTIARNPVCAHHQPPFEAFASWWFDRPNLALLLGPRGGGKSFLSAIHCHLRSRFHPRHGARILGGSLAQSQQIYDALSDAIRDGHGPLGSDSDVFSALLKTEALYRNGSKVTILAASPKSVRGPHVPLLNLDEVDEIDPDLRQSAMGMSMERNGIKAMALMTSTWHKVGGPMAGLIEQAQSGAFPYHSFCLFETLQRCPESRSGPNLEGCTACPLQPWCHDDHPSGLPRAKRSDGHYAIDSAIQKVQSVSRRVFEADFLCSGPRPDGLWFKEFDPAIHVREGIPEGRYPACVGRTVDFDPAFPVHTAIDSGVWTGAVLFQRRDRPGESPLFTFFADFMSYDSGAEANALAIMAIERRHCGEGRKIKRSTDGAGDARNPVGPVVLAEYERCGMKRMERWVKGPNSILDTLNLVESLLMAADGGVSILIHPRCKHLISALQNYRRMKRGTQWQDKPEDRDAHPQEDLIDAMRGGLKTELPEGRKPPRTYNKTTANRMRY
jgi:hypothetical protein